MEKPSQKFDKILSSFGERTSLLNAFQSGATPDDIKQSIIELLSPYFTNRTILENMAVNFLVGDAIALARISEDRWAFELFEYALQSHQQAKTIDANESRKACADWLPAIYEGLSTFWSQLHLELDKDTLDLEEFMHECLRNMGSVIEGSIKPVVKELLHQIRIGRGERPTFQTINEISLGNVIGELMRSSIDPSFFAPRGIRLSQWRNIAQHFSARIQGNEIVCRYGLPNSEREIRLKRSALAEVVKRIFTIFSSLRLAIHLFSFDNLHEIQVSGLLPPNIKVRPEMKILNLVAALASQGFEVVDFQDNEQGATAVIRDVSTLDSSERRLHTVQFAGALWACTHAPVVTIEYHERDGTPNFRTRATRELFERIEREGLALSTLAEEAELTDLKAGRPIPRILKNESQNV